MAATFDETQAAYFTRSIVADKNADMNIEAMLADGEEPPEYLGAFPVEG